MLVATLPRTGLRRLGLARRCEVQVAYAIGVADPVSVMVDTFGTATVSEARIARAVKATFGLQPRQIIEGLDLLRPIYERTAAYGHFGRTEKSFTWELTDKKDALREAAGAEVEDYYALLEPVAVQGLSITPQTSRLFRTATLDLIVGVSGLSGTTVTGGPTKATCRRGLESFIISAIFTST